MREKVEEKEKAKAPKEQCHHFWVIDVANGPSSIGKCKYCGEKKEFLNAFPTINPLRKGPNPLTLPKLKEVKIEKESRS